MFIVHSMTPDPLTIPPTMTVPEATALLRERRFRHLPVVDADGRLKGMVTDRDLRSACPSSVLEGESRKLVEDRVRQTRVEAIMSTDFVTLSPESTLDDALMLFRSRAIGALPVVDAGGRVVGIFSLNDMMQAYRRLFGLGERGSVLVAVEDMAEPAALSRLVRLLEQEGIPFTRLIRADPQGRQPAMIYLRVNTMNIRTVHRVLEQGGFRIHQPTVYSPEGETHA